MPVQMRHDIAQRSEIDLVRCHDLTYGFFDSHKHGQKPLLIRLGQISHFLYVTSQNDAAKSGVASFVCQDDPAEIILP